MKGAAIVYFFAGVIVLHGRNSADPHLPRKTSSAVESLLSLAKSVPPEFRADVLIDLVEYRIVVDNLSTRSLLDEAFTVAADAQEPVALKRVDSAGPLSGALTSAPAVHPCTLVSNRQHPWSRVLCICTQDSESRQCSRRTAPVLSTAGSHIPGIARRA